MVTESNSIQHILIFSNFQPKSINNKTPCVTSFFSPYFLPTNLSRSAFIYMKTVNSMMSTSMYRKSPRKAFQSTFIFNLRNAVLASRSCRLSWRKNQTALMLATRMATKKRWSPLKCSTERCSRSGCKLKLTAAAKFMGAFIWLRRRGELPRPHSNPTAQSSIPCDGFVGVLRLSTRCRWCSGFWVCIRRNPWQ